MSKARIIVVHDDVLWEWVVGGKCPEGECSSTSFCKDLAQSKGNQAICRALSTMADGELSDSPRGTFRKLHE